MNMSTSMSEVDRDELRAMVRDMLDDVSSSERVRTAAESESRYDGQLWNQLRDVGWAGIEAPESLGGGGAHFGDAAVVLTELGRHLTLSPLASTMVLGLGALLLAGTPEQQAAWVPGICDGSARGTAALTTDDASARRAGDEWVVDGRWSYVPDADLADFVVLCARDEDGEVLLLVPVEDLHVTPTPMLDLTRRLCAVEASSLRLPASAELARGAVDALRDRAALATACDSLGVAERALATTVDYAKVRVQFDRPIATFQAIKHKAAEMLERIELARVGVHYAAWAAAVDEPNRAEAAAMAKAFVGRAANEVCGESIQIHGGVGFTWECDAHLHYRRAKANDVLLGYSGTWLHKVADNFLATG
jgi:alkylation response protein AidB-like acyl-CoA dehydrogenase